MAAVVLGACGDSDPGGVDWEAVGAADGQRSYDAMGDDERAMLGLGCAVIASWDSPDDLVEFGGDAWDLDEGETSALADRWERPSQVPDAVFAAYWRGLRSAICRPEHLG